MSPTASREVRLSRRDWGTPDASASGPRCHLLIARPNIQVSTRYVYEHLDARETWPHPDIDGMQAAIRDNDLTGVARRLGNVLETVTAKKYPVIGRLKEEMLSCGALGSLMSGSGPTVFGLYDSREQAQAACRHLRERNLAGMLMVTQFV